MISNLCKFLQVLGFHSTNAGLKRFFQGGGSGGKGIAEWLTDFFFFPDKHVFRAIACRPCVQVCKTTTLPLLSLQLTAAARDKAVSLAKKITRDVDAYMRRTHGESLVTYVLRLAKTKGGLWARIGLRVSGPAYNLLNLTKVTRRKTRKLIMHLVIVQLEAHLPTVLAMQAPPVLQTSTEKLLRKVSLDYDMEGLQRKVFEQHRKELRAFLYGKSEDMAPLVATAVHHVIEANNLLAPSIRLPSVACSICSSTAVGCQEVVRRAMGSSTR